MPDRHSSNELLFELVREFLTEHGRDTADGITLRGLDRKFNDHLGAEERMRDRFDQRLLELEKAVARGSAFDDIPTPSAFTPLAVPMNYGPQPPQVRSKRPSIPSWVKSAPMKAAAHWTSMVIIAIVVALASRCERAVGAHPPAPPSVSSR